MEYIHSKISESNDKLTLRLPTLNSSPDPGDNMSVKPYYIDTAPNINLMDSFLDGKAARSLGNAHQTVSADQNLLNLEPSDFFFFDNPDADSYFKLASNISKLPELTDDSPSYLINNENHINNTPVYKRKPPDVVIPDFSDDEGNPLTIKPSLLHTANPLPDLSDTEDPPPISSLINPPVMFSEKVSGIPQNVPFAKVPAGVSSTGAVPLHDLCKFLRANGQDAEKLDFFGTASQPSNDFEDFEKSLLTIQQGKDLAESQGVQWKHLQNVTVITSAGTFKNAWPNRLGYGGKDSLIWQKEIRRKAIESGGWDYYQIVKYELEEKEKLHPEVIRWINRTKDQKLDSEVRLWVYLNSRKAWDPTRLSNKAVTERTFDGMFSSKNLAEATPFNNFFLRFYDYSPVFPFRAFQTGAALKAMCNDIKHTVSGAKSHVIRKLRKALPVGQGGMLLSELTGQERKWMKSFLVSEPKRSGFRTYTRQPEIRAEVERLLAEHEAAEQEKCLRELVEYIPIDTFSQREKIKLHLWNGLSEEEKEKWRNVAKETEDSDKMTDEERIHLAQKLLVRSAEALSESVGMHILIYTSYICDKEPYATSIECGESPYGMPFHRTQYASQHQQMKQIFREGAAIRAGTNPSRVRESFIPRPAALRLADEDPAETDEPQLPPTVVLPSITFDKKQMDMNNLAKEMAKWLKRSIEAVHGRKLRSTGDFSMKYLCRYESTFFENFPKDGAGNHLRLGEFEAMQDDHLVIWRDHLIASFSAIPSSSPFRFKTLGGQMPKLSMLRSGKERSQTSSHDRTKKKREKVERVKKVEKVKGRKASGRKSLKSGKQAEEEMEEASMSDGSETYSDDEGADPSNLPTRTKIPRNSSQNAAVSIKIYAKREAAYEEQHSKRASLRTTTTKGSPFRPKVLPGSVEQQEKKKEVGIHVQNISGPTSLYLQTEEMKTSTLPDSWKRSGFNERVVTQTLQVEYWALTRVAPCGVALRAPHKSLPTLWGAIEIRATKPKPFAHPSMFDWYAAGTISNAALQRSALLSDSENSFPPFPTRVDGRFSNTISFLLHSLSDPEAPVPTSFKTFDGNPPEALFDILTGVLVKWIEECVGIMCTPAAMRAALPDDKQVLLITRSIAFAYSVNRSSALLKDHTLYRVVISSLGARCINNYLSLILTPIVVAKELELGKKNQPLGPFVKEMVFLVKAFASMFSDNAINACKTGNFFKGIFPNMILSNSEADALDFVLRQRFWCCTNAFDFPLLIASSQEHALLDVVLRLALKKDWAIWSLFDKFCCLITTISAAVPFINDANSQRGALRKGKRESLRRFMGELKDLVQDDYLKAQLPSGLEKSNRQRKQVILPELSDLDEGKEQGTWAGFSALNTKIDQEDVEMENTALSGEDENFEDWVPTEEEAVIQESDIPEDVIPIKGEKSPRRMKRRRVEVAYSSSDDKASETQQVRRSSSPQKKRKITGTPKRVPMTRSVSSTSLLRRSPRKAVSKKY